MKLKVRTITPLFIGKGNDESIIKYNWYIDENNKKVEIMKKDLLSILVEKGFDSDQIRSILYKEENELRNLKEIEEESNEKIRQIIKENKILLDAYIYGRKKDYKKMDINNFINFEDEDVFRYYVPGSSLKGVLRTYAVFKILLDKEKSLIENLANYLCSLLPRERRFKKTIQIKDVIKKLKTYNNKN
ncbi:MAG TPA: type III-A CRISPR-associated RAMP protein Csm5, partial [Nanoarchaeota archaeon]|nr:type III-A CRISPR-associated RAMP protein Csm5 [Nanoarchaeota archaeon]